MAPKTFLPPTMHHLTVGVLQGLLEKQLHRKIQTVFRKLYVQS
jgi:hypothetical protein